MSDARLRHLERLAYAGDIEAGKTLVVIRLGLGIKFKVGEVVIVGACGNPPTRAVIVREVSDSEYEYNNLVAISGDEMMPQNHIIYYVKNQESIRPFYRESYWVIDDEIVSVVGKMA